MNIHILLQARLTSSRLPNKVLLDLKGESIVERCYRICDSVYPTTVVIPNTKGNDKLASFLDQNSIEFFRGPEEDVMRRFALCIQAMNPMPDHVVRITSDCPFVSADLIRVAVASHLSSDKDYTTFYPIVSGLDVEVYRTEALLSDERLNKDVYDREHVKISGSRNLIQKLSLDTSDDYERIRGIVGQDG